jgi:hypothetical protein
MILFTRIVMFGSSSSLFQIFGHCCKLFILQFQCVLFVISYCNISAISYTMFTKLSINLFSTAVSFMCTTRQPH